MIAAIVDRRLSLPRLNPLATVKMIPVPQEEPARDSTCAETVADVLLG